MESAPLPSPAPAPSPPQTPMPVQAQDVPSYKEYQTARSKPIRRFLLISNLALGAYIFVQAGKKGATAHHVHHQHHTRHGNE